MFLNTNDLVKGATSVFNVMASTGRKFAAGISEDLQQQTQKARPFNISGGDYSADTHRVLAGDASGLNKEPGSNLELRAGVVQYSVPLHGSMRIALDNFGGMVQGRLSTHGANQSGAYDVSIPKHGSGVYVVADHDNQIATVIAATPPANDDYSSAFSDMIVQGSGVGVYASPQYRDYIGSLSDGGSVLMFDADRPLDGLPGDHTVMSSTGVGLHADDEMAFLRASEISGLFVFREDGYVRLTGEQLAVESPGHSSESGIAQFEVFADTGDSLYPWEAVGRGSPGELATVSRGADALFEGPYAPLEPQAIDTEQIRRLENFGGYLGQGSLTVLSAPQPAGEDDVNTASLPILRRGLFRSQVMMDGTFLTETARQMFFAKVSDVPVLRRTSPPDFPDGFESYKGSGYFGSGDDHVVQQLENTDPAALTMAAEEAYSYASAWQGLNAAVYNPTVDVAYNGEPGSAPNYSSLSQDDQIELPTPEQVEIDHRYGNVDIYRVMSLFGFLPNGDVVIEDGFGASIKLSQGRVEISGTAVSVNTAKTFNVFAQKVSITGQEFVDLSSSTKDVRIKAERNMLLLSGNGRTGGMLLENRSVSKSGDWPDEPGDAVAAGIAIKSNRSYVGVYGGDVLLKSGPGSAGAVQGRVMLDAGAGTLESRALVHNRYTQSAFYDHYGASADNIRKTTIWNESYSQVAGALGVNGQLLVTGGVQAGSSFVSLTGHFASVIAPSYDYRVGLVQDPDLIRTNLQDLRDTLDEGKAYGTQVATQIRETLESEDQPLNPQSIRDMSFGYPSSDAYQASNVTLSQPRWQRLAGGSAAAWEERPVTYKDQDDTMPWPGKKTWERQDSFRQLDEVSTTSFFDKSLGRAKDPNTNRELYEAAKPPSTQTGSLLSGLRTIR